MSDDLNKLFLQATRKALVGWETDLTADEIIQELWVWYLESPYIQTTLGKLHRGEAVLYVRSQVFNILTGEAKSRDLFDGRSLYSSDNVKDALSRASTNRYLVDILPLAMQSLEKQNEGYVEAIRVRYDDGVVPVSRSKQQVYLSRAVKSLTEHVNVIAITAGIETDERGRISAKEGPGSKHAVFPDTRKSKGADHSDPTADMAIGLIEAGDQEVVLCATTADRHPIKGDNGRYLDSAQTTTYRKEFLR
ncbi:helix-turn-helix DNA-binding domain protein [Mycobacterium phage Acolyte]|nr:helix-turn-helix DNA-binding domain protein [Mycobacterium phage Acolyte]